MEFNKRAAARFEKEWATVRPVLMQFRYDHTISMWRVTFRPRGENTLPRVLHFGNAEKLREIFRRFGSRQMAEDVAAMEFAILNTKRGAVELKLEETQLRPLRTPKRPTLNTERGVSRWNQK